MADSGKVLTTHVLTTDEVINNNLKTLEVWVNEKLEMKWYNNKDPLFSCLR